MDTTDTLQVKIDRAREELSPESRQAIDAVNWVEVIFSMNTKYNSEQLENLKIETELLLCGLTSTVDFPKEIETRMKISHNETASLLEQMDKLIFQKIQEKLEEKINKDSNIINNSADIPLPPYKGASMPKVQSNPIVNSSYSHNNETDMYREHGIDIISNEYPQTTKMDILKNQEELKEEKTNDNSNIIANKLFNNTASQKVVTDYSIPAVNIKKQDFSNIQGVAPSKPHDPYHEPI